MQSPDRHRQHVPRAPPGVYAPTSRKSTRRGGKRTRVKPNQAQSSTHTQGGNSPTKPPVQEPRDADYYLWWTFNRGRPRVPFIWPRKKSRRRLRPQCPQHCGRPLSQHYGCLVQLIDPLIQYESSHGLGLKASNPGPHMTAEALAFLIQLSRPPSSGCESSFSLGLQLQLQPTNRRPHLTEEALAFLTLWLRPP
jgi:hypothetical protein